MGGSSTKTTSGQNLASQYGFVDPYGTTKQLQNTLYGNNGALQDGALGLYNQNADQVLRQIAGLSGPLQETLSEIANYQANNALNAAGSNFANLGALGSGAAASAFGQAIANPFAQAQAQLQSGQLSAGSSALQSLMGASTNAYGQALNAGTNLMENTSGLVAPVMTTSGGKGATPAVTVGTGLLTGGLGSLLSPTLSGAGTALSKLGK